MSIPIVIQNMLEVSKSMTQNIEKCALDFPTNFTQAHFNLSIMDIWRAKLDDSDSNNTIKVLNESIWDLFSSIYLAANGLYRTSFISLRSSLELGLSYLYFCDHNYDYLLWKKDKFDMKWALLTDETRGVVTPSYILFFYNGIDEKANTLVENIRNLYRECSQYVHGKYDFMHTVSEDSIRFIPEKFSQWNSLYTRTVQVLATMLEIRYGLELFSDEETYNIKELTKVYLGVKENG